MQGEDCKGRMQEDDTRKLEICIVFELVIYSNDDRVR